ncbi:PLC-like phosphodiesterase [Roridomyces roridus]|uniref:PLC-like phosphodiesterase n=1 Tax=Roridomyces roridus TaxID=1738132 RepID=A0AAD7FPT9_9AGAR|nr:PLC-like phosphodiesterase [Roridomyces roridus]
MGMWLPLHLWILLFAARVVWCGPLATPTRRATVCNGHAELCSRLYSNVTFVGAHDSFAFSEDPFALARDQEVDIPTQLNLGVRLLQAQAHMNGDVLHFCHTSCDLFDGGPVLDYLRLVKNFLDTNPNEILTLLVTNPEGLSPKDVWRPIFDQAGITNLTYVPPSLPISQSQWPTLGSMIDSGKRVVVFMDAEADSINATSTILPEFSMVWETPFSQTNASFPCSVNRIHGPLSTEDHIYLINHSLNVNIIPIGSGVIISDPLDAPVTNGVPSIMAHAASCAPLGANRYPSFILLDYVNIGQGFLAADIMNGLPPPTSSSSASLTMSATSSPSSKNSGAVGFQIRRAAILAVVGCILFAL